MKLLKEKVLPVIMNALREDVGNGDITTALLLREDVTVSAEIIVKERCVLAGLDIAKWIFDTVDEKIVFSPLYKDRAKICKGKKVLSLRGSAKNILACERVVLNFLGRLSGIATLTDKFVGKVKGTKAKIFDTRKTTPGIRELERYAVKVGGGCNHRMGLWDSILIKDNHLESLRFRLGGLKSGIIDEAVKMIRTERYRDIEIEVTNLKELSEAMQSGADIIMLDNMKIEDIKKAIELRKSSFSRYAPGIILEVSGNVNLDNVSMIAKTGVDRISIGSLTHSAPSIDFSLKIC